MIKIQLPVFFENTVKAFVTMPPKKEIQRRQNRQERAARRAEKNEERWKAEQKRFKKSTKKKNYKFSHLSIFKD